MTKFLPAIIALLASTACKNSKFAGDGGSHAEPTAIPIGAVQQVPTYAPPLTTPQQNAPVITGGGSIQPNYGACASLPGAGKMKYPARCGDNQVVVIINDGSAQEMSCCPLNGTSIFSPNPAELFQERAGRCQVDEVGVGMISSSDGRIYCSKLNVQFLKLGPPQKAQYVSLTSNISPEIRAIAQSYNVLDMCACTLGTILLGGHTATDNVCTDDCAAVQPR